MAHLLLHALGYLRQPPLRPQRDFRRSLDMAALSRLSSDTAGYEGRSRPVLLEGVNQFVGHGWPYSPESAGGTRLGFYASAVFNDHNPW